MPERDPTLIHACLLAAAIVAAVAAFYDVRKRIVPNWLTYGALLAAPLLRGGLALFASGDPVAAILSVGGSLAGAALCLLVPAVLYRSGAIGGGDVKLLAAIGALLAPIDGLEVQTYGFIVLAATIPLRLSFEGKLLATMKGWLLVAFNALVPPRHRRPVPTSAFGSFRLAPALFVGVLVVARERF